MDIAKKKELFAEFFAQVEMNYLSEDIPDEEKRNIEKDAMGQILDLARQEMRNIMH